MNKLLFIDTMTTGLNTERCAIWSIGGIFCEDTAMSLIEKKRFELRMRPFDGARITDTSLWAGDMTRSELAWYPSQELALMSFKDMLGEEVDRADKADKLYIAGFNSAAFDSIFLRRWFERCGDAGFRDWFYVQTLDLMSLSAAALMEQRDGMPDFHMNTTARWLGAKAVVGTKASTLDNALTCENMYRALKERLNIGEDRIYRECKSEPVRNYR